jgi:molecular chaperone DnaK
MFRQKIDYGIDLGTTNSAISRFEKGRVRIIKSERLQKDTTPSCVHFTKRGQLLVGDAAYSRLAIDPENTKTEFKRTIGTEVTYYFPNIDKSLTPEEMSAEVLKIVRSSVKDEDLSSVVITVPADFDQVQIEATQEAAELAGFEYCELLQEPIAASLAYIMDEETIGGNWLVFDMGGGTFDAALMSAEEGIIKVIDTAGDNHLGGKNMDLLIVDEVIIPHLKKDFKIDGILADRAKRMRLESAWKRIAEQYKIQLSSEDKVMVEPDDPTFLQDDDGNYMDVCIEVTRTKFEELIKPLVDRAIALALDVITRNRRNPADLKTVLLIGGPTYMPYIRNRIQEEINPNINVTIDPMTAVAAGAALFASTKSTKIKEVKPVTDVTTIPVHLEYPNSTSDSEVMVKIKVDTANLAEVPAEIVAEMYRLDQGWTSGRIPLENNEGVFKLALVDNEINGFAVYLYDGTGKNLPCAPDSFSILQGIFISNPPIPHDICIEAETEELGHTTIPLLLKNQILPAIGKKVFKTKKDLRPGEKEDIFSIIVREGVKNTRPVSNIMVGNITITGEDLTQTVREDSDVEITLKMDESRRINVTAYFPYIDETIDNVLETSFRTAVIDQDQLKKEIEDELARVISLKDSPIEGGSLSSNELAEIEVNLREIIELNDKRKDDLDSGYGLRYRLNELQIKVEKAERGVKWERIEHDLVETYKHAKKIVEIFGEKRHKEALRETFNHLDSVVKRKDKNGALQLIRRFSTIRHDLLSKQPGFWIAILNNIGASFKTIKWKDPELARELVDTGRKILTSQGFSDKIKKIVRSLWNLMTPEEKEKTQRARPDIPLYRV